MLNLHVKFKELDSRICNCHINATVIGERAVGKSCLIVSMLTSKFPEEYVPTVMDIVPCVLYCLTFDTWQFYFYLWKMQRRCSYRVWHCWWFCMYSIFFFVLFTHFQMTGYVLFPTKTAMLLPLYFHSLIFIHLNLLRLDGFQKQNSTVLIHPLC